MIRCVPEVPPTAKRSLPWAVAVVVTLLIGGAALCAFGLLAITANYDGFVSWFNPFAAGSCCAAVFLVALAPVAWRLLARPADRGRKRNGD